MAAPDKDTIYIDIDDEITGIIDKVHSSASRIVALVLPKRATVFQSVVNMKLVKRAADAAKKRVVLVTTEANLMPLASIVGLHVAATPQSKPEIPAATETALTDDTATESDSEYTIANAGDQAIGDLAQRSGHVIATAQPEEAISLSTDESEDDEPGEDKPRKIKKEHALKVPNFNAFRLRLLLASLLLIGVIVGLYVCAVVLPKAAITIKTNSSSQNVNMTVALDTAAQKLDTAKLIAPAKSEQQQKTTSQQADATGQKNTGVVAAGSITMTATACAPNLGTPNSIAAGTGVSTNGLTFITGEKTIFGFDHFSGGSCAVYKSGTVAMTAQNPGSKYNVTNATFTVAGRADASGTGSATGGTDVLVKVVSQTDIDNAKQKLATQDIEAVKSTLQQVLRQDGLYPLVVTFKAGDPLVTTSAAAGDTADSVTVTQAITYTMLGVKQADLDALITASVGSQIDTKKQIILDDGLSAATFTVGDSTGTTTHVSVQTAATVGPDINPATVKLQARGKKIGDVKSMINAIPGVTSVDVNLSPFWVSTVPNDLSKVTVTIDKVK